MQTKITQAILPVAGLGTRFLPWTMIAPKELLPIGNKPVIQFLVDECLSVGITEICFVLSPGKEAIVDYFRPSTDGMQKLRPKDQKTVQAELQKYADVHFHIVYQNEQLGDGHAILQAKDWVNSDMVAVLFGDDLIEGEMTGLLQLVKAYDTIDEKDLPAAMLCLQNIPRSYTERYGIADIVKDSPSRKLHRITKLVEKPKPEDAPSTLGVVGKYLIPRSTFDVLPYAQASHGGEIRLIDALIAQMAGSLNIFGYEVKGARYDTGTPEGWKKAVAALA